MTVPPQASSIDDDFIPILNDLKRELVWEFEHSKTGALPMLKARDRMDTYIHSTTTATLEELRGMLPEKRPPSDPKWHNEMHPPEPDEDGEIDLGATSEGIIRNANDGFNDAIDQVTKAIDTLIEREKS